jgi:hypothetical protein
MLCKTLVASALCAVVLSAPTVPSFAGGPVSQGVVNGYFNMLAGKVAAGKSLPSAPVCDLSKAVLPIACKNHLLVSYQQITNSSPYSAHTSPTSNRRSRPQACWYWPWHPKLLLHNWKRNSCTCRPRSCCNPFQCLMHRCNIPRSSPRPSKCRIAIQPHHPLAIRPHSLQPPNFRPSLLLQLHHT